MYTKQQVERALETFENVGSYAKAVRILGYPTSRQLRSWVTNGGTTIFPRKDNVMPKAIECSRKRASQELKQSAIIRSLTGTESLREIAKSIGYTATTIYTWRKKFLEGDFGMPQAKLKRPKPAPPGATEIEKRLRELEIKNFELQLEKDILEETIKILKKEKDINPTSLSNREKAVMIGVLKEKYSLPELLRSLKLARSSYYYHCKQLEKEDKYSHIRNLIKKIFIENYQCYGVRRICFALRRLGIYISKDVVRRLMKEESIKVVQRRRRGYSSYKGEITQAPANMIQRDFHADEPFKKLLTDITEFSIPDGKLYFSPVIDCYDGMVIAWTLGNSPNANLVNTMLDKVILQADGRTPILHSDRGCHYRWPEWIKKMDEAGFIRSMSKKGCSPDNAACEGFFGTFKKEFFYGQNWQNTTRDQLAQMIEDYINWYCNDRITNKFKGLTLKENRLRNGVELPKVS